MSQTLTLELSDEIYAAVQRQAEIAGTSPTGLVAMIVERQYRPDVDQGDECTTQHARQAARARFEQHFGEVDLGCATGVENELIDADLAREYANTHEDV